MRYPDLKKLIASFLLAGMAEAAPAAELVQADGATNALYREVVASPVRSDADRAVDAARKPFEFLQFTHVQPGMRVLDVATGRGYTTQLLALAVGSGGSVWAQTDKLRPEMRQRLEEHPQRNIILVQRPYDDPVPADAPPLDLVTLILNYHDIAYMPVDRAQMNLHLFNALKPGGHLVIFDHSARNGTGAADAKTLHRIDEALVLQEVRRAGFRLEQEGDFLRNPADPKEQPFFKMKMPTDIFALRFVKP